MDNTFYDDQTSYGKLVQYLTVSGNFVLAEIGIGFLVELHIPCCRQGGI